MQISSSATIAEVRTVFITLPEKMPQRFVDTSAELVFGDEPVGATHRLLDRVDRIRWAGRKSGVTAVEH